MNAKSSDQVLREDTYTHTHTCVVFASILKGLFMVQEYGLAELYEKPTPTQPSRPTPLGTSATRGGKCYERTLDPLTHKGPLCVPLSLTHG